MNILSSRTGRGQRGMTLIEFMVSITIGLIMVAAIATLIANQSQNRAEIDKSGKMIENGRFALQTITNDVVMAGYWVEMGTPMSDMTLNALPDPCATATATATANSLYHAVLLHVQGYDSPTTLPVSLQVCVKNHKSGTDVLVVRRGDADYSDLETSGNVDWTKLKAGQTYIQTGLLSGNLNVVVKQANGTSDSTTFSLTKKDKVTKATPRRFQTHIYYISQCSVEVSGSCVNADGGTPIPTLKMVELYYSGSSPAFRTVTIAEGIENMQIDYLTYDSSGIPDATEVNGSALTYVTWQDVMSLKVYLLARSPEPVAGFTDNKTYSMGTAGAPSIPVAETGYRRHVFVQSARMINPLGRRTN